LPKLDISAKICFAENIFFSVKKIRGNEALSRHNNKNETIERENGGKKISLPLFQGSCHITDRSVGANRFRGFKAVERCSLDTVASTPKDSDFLARSEETIFPSHSGPLRR
jgi:hypothetical protein